jgi:glycerol-3-phosphate dehydrogenase (NAD(P)+)
MLVNVLGSGSWGTSLAILLARNGHDVCLMGRDEEEIATLHSVRENLRYLPGFVVPEGVHFALLEPRAAQMHVIAVPSGAVREVIQSIPQGESLVVVASKGLELGSNRTLSAVVREQHPEAKVGVLSGPNLAVEIVRGVPTAAVAAFSELESGQRVQDVFMCRTFRVYLSHDVIGVELAGALKNVLAIGAGMSDGLGFGDNTKGALLARGLNEMTRLGLALGAHVDTFMGLAGVGDLFATAASQLSRNYRVGYALGQSKLLPDALKEIGQVAEGVVTSECAAILARQNQVQMPVFDAIDSVIRGKVPPLQAVSLLMERVPRQEGIS